MIPPGMQRVYRRFERWRSRLGAACRRLALIERLPEGNQAEVLEAIRREALSSAELGGMVHLWLGCAERRQPEYLLAHPRPTRILAQRSPRPREWSRRCAIRDRAKPETRYGSASGCCWMCWAAWMCGWRTRGARG